MNERIQELAMQAYIADSMERSPNYKRSQNTDIIMKDLAGFNKKFAELIVQECSSICYSSGMQDSDAHAQNLLYEFNIHNCRNDK